MQEPPSNGHASSLPALPSHHTPEGRLTLNHLGEDQQAGVGRVVSPPLQTDHVLPAPVRPPPFPLSACPLSAQARETKCFQILQTPGHQKQPTCFGHMLKGRYCQHLLPLSSAPAQACRPRHAPSRCTRSGHPCSAKPFGSSREGLAPSRPGGRIQGEQRHGIHKAEKSPAQRERREQRPGAAVAL